MRGILWILVLFSCVVAGGIYHCNKVMDARIELRSLGEALDSSVNTCQVRVKQFESLMAHLTYEEKIEISLRLQEKGLDFLCQEDLLLVNRLESKVEKERPHYVTSKAVRRQR